MENEWDQLPEEKSNQFEAFRSWCDLPPTMSRTIPNAMALAGVPFTRSRQVAWQQWKKRFRWEARCSARVRYMARLTDDVILHNRLRVSARALEISADALDNIDPTNVKDALTAVRIASEEAKIRRDLALVPKPPATDDADKKARDFLGIQAKDINPEAGPPGDTKDSPHPLPAAPAKPDKPAEPA